MSVQNALMLIQQLRNNSANSVTTMPGFDNLVQLAEAKALPCTKEQLQIAFVLDWRMRWAKARQQQTDK